MVGNVTVPVNVGEAKFALLAIVAHQSFKSLPVEPSNTAILSPVALAGHITSPEPLAAVESYIRCVAAHNVFLSITLLVQLSFKEIVNVIEAVSALYTVRFLIILLVDAHGAATIVTDVALLVTPLELHSVSVPLASSA